MSIVFQQFPVAVDYFLGYSNAFLIKQEYQIIKTWLQLKMNTRGFKKT
jgi:hypothetical protein